MYILQSGSSSLAEKQIEEARSVFVPIAERGNMLLTLLGDLSVGNPLYSTSLELFTSLFRRALFVSVNNIKSQDLWYVKIIYDLYVTRI